MLLDGFGKQAALTRLVGIAGLAAHHRCCMLASGMVGEATAMITFAVGSPACKDDNIRAVGFFAVGIAVAIGIAIGIAATIAVTAILGAVALPPPSFALLAEDFDFGPGVPQASIFVGFGNLTALLFG